MSTEFYDWEDIRAELHDGDDQALEEERVRTEAWMRAFRLAEESQRSHVADVARPRRTSQVRRQG